MILQHIIRGEPGCSKVVISYQLSMLHYSNFGQYTFKGVLACLAQEARAEHDTLDGQESWKVHRAFLNGPSILATLMAIGQSDTQNPKAMMQETILQRSVPTADKIKKQLKKAHG